MMRDGLRNVGFLVLSIILTAATARAQTPPTDGQRAEARARYQNATRKFDVGKYAEAAQEFEVAYELSGAPEILYNIAQSLRLAGNYEKALLFYHNYLRRKEDPENRVEVENRITELQQKIREQKEAAQRKAPPPPPPPQPLSHGTSQPTTPVAVAPTSPAPEPRAAPRWLTPLSGALLAVGVAGIGTGVAMSFLARSASNDVQAAARMHATFDTGLQSRQNAGKVYDAVAIAGYVVGGVLVAGGAVGLAVSLKKRGAKAEASVIPVVTPTGAAVCVAGSF